MLDLYDYFTLRDTAIVRAKKAGGPLVPYEGALRVKIAFTQSGISHFSVYVPLREFYPDGSGSVSGFVQPSDPRLVCDVLPTGTGQPLACTYTVTTIGNEVAFAVTIVG